MLIRNGNVLHWDRLENGVDLRIVDQQIAEIGPACAADAGELVVDASGCFVLPGFVDLHTHGVRDALVQEDSLKRYARFEAEQGVTACAPTLLGSFEANVRVLQSALSETDGLRTTPNVVGFRLELPYLFKPGAAQPTALGVIDQATTEALYAAGEGHIRIWDVSPELEGAVPFIRWATEHGIVTSLAHSSATIEQTRRAVDAGLSLVTHLFDTFDLPIMTDPGVYPVGLVDYILIEDRLTAEIIPDGVHVHPYLVEKTLRCKSPERVAFISDSVRGAGNPPGIYSGLYPGMDIEVTQNRGVRRVLDDGLSGSAITQLNSFRNAVRLFGKSVPEASRLCSRTPAVVLGVKSKGYLAAGMDADIVVLDQKLDLVHTVVGGNVIV